MTKQQILEEARSSTREEQLDLASDLCDAVEPDEVPISPVLAAELDRRVAEDDAYTAPAEPVEVVVARILRGEY